MTGFYPREVFPGKLTYFYPGKCVSTTSIYHSFMPELSHSPHQDSGFSSCTGVTSTPQTVLDLYFLGFDFVFWFVFKLEINRLDMWLLFSTLTVFETFLYTNMMNKLCHTVGCKCVGGSEAVMVYECSV